MWGQDDDDDDIHVEKYSKKKENVKVRIIRFFPLSIDLIPVS